MDSNACWWLYHCPGSRWAVSCVYGCGCRHGLHGYRYRSQQRRRDPDRICCAAGCGCAGASGIRPQPRDHPMRIILALILLLVAGCANLQPTSVNPAVTYITNDLKAVTAAAGGDCTIQITAP